ncbi:G kinase-anchoring protein 1-like [Diadema setosum]|uniref:G kinase-anchoring protein 1-like n=1 Tax=Diadema setosum TaxID=31175 RepID=UPI003B3A348E
MAAMQLSSRFGVLKIDGDDSPPELDSGEELAMNQRKEKEAKLAVETAKKKNKKKKKAQQQSSAKAELREMAFTKISSVPKALASSPPSTRPEVLKIGSPPTTARDWEQWQDRDQEFIDNQYQRDIQRALLQSKMEFERQKKFMEEVGPALEEEPVLVQPMNRKERRKHLQGKEKPQPMTLQEFHNQAEEPAKPCGDVGLDVIDLPRPPSPKENKEIMSSVKEELNRVMAKEKKKSKKKKDSESEKATQELDSIRQVQYEDELEKKTAEISQLHEVIDKLKEELAQVKKRNKQLCFIIGQGEMKDKADVLLQVEDLTTVKDELTAEVAELYGALEQEKSKVSSLKSELQRLQEKKK